MDVVNVCRGFFKDILYDRVDKCDERRDTWKQNKNTITMYEHFRGPTLIINFHGQTSKFNGGIWIKLINIISTVKPRSLAVEFE